MTESHWRRWTWISSGILFLLGYVHAVLSGEVGAARFGFALAFPVTLLAVAALFFAWKPSTRRHIPVAMLLGGALLTAGAVYNKLKPFAEFAPTATTHRIGVRLGNTLVQDNGITAVAEVTRFSTGTADTYASAEHPSVDGRYRVASLYQWTAGDDGPSIMVVYQRRDGAQITAKEMGEILELQGGAWVRTDAYVWWDTTDGYPKNGAPKRLAKYSSDTRQFTAMIVDKFGRFMSHAPDFSTP